MLLHLQISSFRPHTDSRYYLTAKPQVVYRTNFLLLHPYMLPSYLYLCGSPVSIRLLPHHLHIFSVQYIFRFYHRLSFDPSCLTETDRRTDHRQFTLLHPLKISAECLYIIQHLSSGVQFHLRKFLTAKPGRHNTWK